MRAAATKLEIRSEVDEAAREAEFVEWPDDGWLDMFATFDELEQHELALLDAVAEVDGVSVSFEPLAQDEVDELTRADASRGPHPGGPRHAPWR